MWTTHLFCKRYLPVEDVIQLLTALIIQFQYTQYYVKLTSSYTITMELKYLLTQLYQRSINSPNNIDLPQWSAINVSVYFQVKQIGIISTLSIDYVTELAAVPVKRWILCG